MIHCGQYKREYFSSDSRNGGLPSFGCEPSRKSKNDGYRMKLQIISLHSTYMLYESQLSSSRLEDVSRALRYLVGRLVNLFLKECFKNINDHSKCGIGETYRCSTEC